MQRAALLAWGLSVGSPLRKSQAKTLAALVAAAVGAGRIRLAALGRRLAGPALGKHKIKRAWRFCANPRVAVADGLRGLLERRGRRGGPLLVALDWVEVRSFPTLMAAAVFGGRALPLLGASYPEWERYKSQNDLEEGLLRLLRALAPAGVAIIVPADRGFGRAELARTCLGLPGLHFVPRARPDVGVRHPRYRGLLSDYPVRPGIRRVLRQAAYRLSGPVTLDVVIRWKKGLPAGRDEPWFLITDLPGNAAELTALYARRMAVEEPSRDAKSLRNGWALRLTQLTEARRLGRLLLIVALAYGLLVGLGLLARQKYRPAPWCSTNREQRGRPQCSAFTVGRAVCDLVRERPAAALQAAADATTSAAINWG